MVLPVSLATAAACTLLYLVLSLRVIGGRKASSYAIDVEPDPELRTRIRTHANFAEYVPLALVMLAMLELAGISRSLLAVLGLVLVVARLCHAIGMPRPAPNPLRLVGILGTLGVLTAQCVAAVVLLAVWGR